MNLKHGDLIKIKYDYLNLMGVLLKDYNSAHDTQILTQLLSSLPNYPGLYAVKTTFNQIEGE